MLSWLRRHRQSIFIATIAIFLIGIFVGLGGYYFTGRDYSESVALVGRAKIPYILYQTRVNQYLDAMRDSNKNQEVPDETVKQIKQGMLRDMIVDEILSQQAEKMGLKVTDLEVAFRLRNTPRFVHDGAFDQQMYFQALRALRTTPEEYERQERKSMLSAKFKQLIYITAKLTPAEIRDEFIKHIAQYKEAARLNPESPEAIYLEKHKVSGSNLDQKEVDQYAQSLQQSRALELINFYLRQISTQIEIRTFLDQREQGA